MSSVYATEPGTTGRVILETTHGPLEIQLWSRECPTTTKLFLQLCLDGFYDNMLFHRIVPDFLIQTGALRQPSVAVDNKKLEKYRQAVKADHALERRRFELHSRLRFNHRGQIAMALGVDDDPDAEIHPQFFITLDEASFLDGKHVLFGTVAGPTIFNALRIGKVEVGEDHQPVDLEHAPRVTSVRIVENTLHEDIVPQMTIPWHQEKKAEKKKKKRKGKLDKNVLSFGDDVEEVLDSSAGGIKSSHDALESKMFRKEVDEELQGALREEDGKDQRTCKKKLEEPPEAAMTKSAAPMIPKHKSSSDSEPSAKREAPSRPGAEKADNNTRRMSETIHENEAKSSSLSAVEARRAKYTKGRKNKREREEDTMSKLIAFQSKVKEQVTATTVMTKAGKTESLASRMARRALEKVEGQPSNDQAPTYHGQILEDEDYDVDRKPDWLKTKFKCRRHMDIDSPEANLGGDGRNMDDYEVVDERDRETDGRNADSERSREKKRRKKHHHHHNHRDKGTKTGCD